MPGGEEAIVRDLDWLGVGWDEGPVRQSERQERYREAAAQLGVERFDGVQLLRPDGTPTYHLASVVDDADFGITHVVRGNDHRPNEALHRRLAQALGATPPRVRPSRAAARAGRQEALQAARRRDGRRPARGRVPGRGVRAYLDELDLPRHDVHFDERRLRRLAIDAIAAMPDAELAAEAGAPLELVPALRGARDLAEARAFAQAILEPGARRAPGRRGPTLARFVELRVGANGTLAPDGAKAIVRELKAVGGDLHALRLALTGRDSGPELWAVVAALPRDEALRRAGATP